MQVIALMHFEHLLLLDHPLAFHLSVVVLLSVVQGKKVVFEATLITEVVLRVQTHPKVLAHGQFTGEGMLDLVAEYNKIVTFRNCAIFAL